MNRDYIVRVAVGSMCVMFACAAPTPVEYQRGTQVAMPARSVPRVGPATGQPPGYASPEEYPRGPHKRVLPPTRGPGIWAGDEPKASDEDESDPITWRQYFFPRDLDLREASEGKECYLRFVEDAKASVDIERGGIVSRTLGAMPENQRWCFTVKAYHHCVAEKHKIREAERAKVLLTQTGTTIPFALKDLKRTAGLLEKARCIDDLPSDTERVLRLVNQAISKALRGASGPRN